MYSKMQNTSYFSDEKERKIISILLHVFNLNENKIINLKCYFVLFKCINLYSKWYDFFFQMWVMLHAFD